MTIRDIVTILGNLGGEKAQRLQWNRCALMRCEFVLEDRELSVSQEVSQQSTPKASYVRAGPGKSEPALTVSLIKEEGLKQGDSVPPESEIGSCFHKGGA